MARRVCGDAMPQPLHTTAIVLLLAWVALCTWIRAVPAYTYAANVSSFSAAMLVFASGIDGRYRSLTTTDLLLMFHLFGSMCVLQESPAGPVVMLQSAGAVPH